MMKMIKRFRYWVLLVTILLAFPLAERVIAQFTSTPNLSLQLPTIGSTTNWGTYLNADLTTLDTLLGCFGISTATCTVPGTLNVTGKVTGVVAMKPAASDASIFVAVSGSDTTGDGLSRGTAYASWSKAMTQCGTFSTSHVTILPGIYTTNAQVTIPNNCTVDAYGAQLKAGASFPTSTPLVVEGTSSAVDGALLEGATLNCNGVAHCIGLYSEHVNEQSGWRDLVVNNAPGGCVKFIQQTNGAVAANFNMGSLYCIEGAAPDATADGVFIGGATGITMFSAAGDSPHWTIEGLVGANYASGIHLVNVGGASLRDVHCEEVNDCVLVDGSNQIVLEDINGGANGTNVVHINSSANNSNVLLFGITRNGAATALTDDKDSLTVTPAIGMWAMPGTVTLPNLVLNSSGGGTILHQPPNTPSSFTQTDTPLAGSIVVNVTGSVSIASGFGTTPAIVNQGAGSGPTSIEVNVGTGGVATSGVLTMPAAPVGWSCSTVDMNTNIVTRETAFTTTSVTLTAASAWTASDKLLMTCWPF